MELRALLRRFISVCQTIAYAHTRGVIHRDIKPGNIMLGAYDETLVVDWGLAHRFAQPEPQPTAGQASLHLEMEGQIDKTVLGLVKGSPAYMSPEQARGDRNQIGPASDIYALGATLYAVLTGQRPFDGTSRVEVLEKVKAGLRQSPRAVNSQVSPALDAICTKAMRLNPEDRYATARDLAQDLELWLADEPVSAWREPRTVRLRRWVKRHRTMVTTSAAAMLVAGVALVWSNIEIGLKNVQLAEKNTTLSNLNQALEESNHQERKAREQAEQFLAMLLDGHKSQLLRDIVRKYGSQPEKQPHSADRLMMLDELARRSLDVMRTTPDNQTAAEQMGYALYHRAKAETGSIAESVVRQRFDQARSQLQSVLDADAANQHARTWLSLTYYEMGARWERIGKTADAREDYLAARGLLATVVEHGAPSETAIVLANVTLDLIRLDENTKAQSAEQLWELATEAQLLLRKARKAGSTRTDEDEALVSRAKLRFHVILLGTRLGKIPEPSAALAALLADMNGDLKPSAPSVDFNLVHARACVQLATANRNHKEYLPALKLLEQAQADLASVDSPSQSEVRKECEGVEALFVSTLFQFAETADQTDPDTRAALRDQARTALEIVRHGELRMLREMSAAAAIRRLSLHQQRERLESLLKALGP